MTLKVPSPAILNAWVCGNNPNEDADLDDLVGFFTDMVRGTSALGARYSLATEALRVQLDLALAAQRFRTREAARQARRASATLQAA